MTPYQPDQLAVLGIALFMLFSVCAMNLVLSVQTWNRVKGMSEQKD